MDKDGTPISPWAMLRKMGLKEIGTESLSNLFTLMSALESLDCLRFSTERVENSFYTETHMFIDLTGRGHALVMGVRSIQNHARSVQSPESDLAGA